MAGFVCSALKKYYRFNPRSAQEGMRGSLKLKDYMPMMHPPLLSNKLVGVKAELLLLKILVKENLPELSAKINEIAFPLEFYFARHLLSLFADLLHVHLLYRVWDRIILEVSHKAEVII